MAKIILVHGKLKIRNLMKITKLRKKMHQYTISNGKMVGDFEGLYKILKTRFFKLKKKNLKHLKK